MSLALLVVTAVRIEGRSKAEAPRDYGVSRRWVYELARRFDTDVEAGLQPRSRRPRRSPHRTTRCPIPDQRSPGARRNVHPTPDQREPGPEQQARSLTDLEDGLGEPCRSEWPRPTRSKVPR